MKRLVGANEVAFSHDKMRRLGNAMMLEGAKRTDCDLKPARECRGMLATLPDRPVAVDMLPVLKELFFCGSLDRRLQQRGKGEGGMSAPWRG